MMNVNKCILLYRIYPLSNIWWMWINVHYCIEYILYLIYDECE